MIRFLILIPFALMASALSALFLLLVLTAVAPALGDAFIGAFTTAFWALWNAILNEAPPQDIAGIGSKATTLAFAAILAPVGSVAVLGELFRIGGMLNHAIATGALSVALPMLALNLTRLPNAAEGQVLACLFLAGAGAGSLYFAIAGRKDQAVTPAPDVSIKS
jgi:hypothetical protein